MPALERAPEPGPAALPADIAATLEQVLHGRGGLGQVQAVPLRRLVGDHCEKFIALDRRDRPVAFVVLSPPEHPRAVATAAERALQARARLGGALGASVLTPLHVGESNGASYSISTYCEPLSRHRWVARWQGWRLAPAVLRWLSAVVEQTAAGADSGQVERLFARPLQALAVHRAVDEDVRAAAARAGDSLRSGAWRPRTVLAHNDFWLGNLVQRRDAPRGTAPFFVIDWAGSLTEGHAVYDLVRMSMSLNLPPRQLQPLLASHCRALGCEPAMAGHYLVSALGHLCENLGEWPIEQFARTASVCHRFLTAAR
jgi:aminoglycoside phosphotransferase (APT) family kinase protein